MEKEAGGGGVMKAKKLMITPCDICRYNPPSSGDGKPCTQCPAEGVRRMDVFLREKEIEKWPEDKNEKA